jgi:hypothetical protein
MLRPELMKAASIRMFRRIGKQKYFKDLKEHFVPRLMAENPHKLRLALETEDMILNAGCTGLDPTASWRPESCA